MTRSIHRALVAASALALLSARTTAAQDAREIAARVARASDGIIQMSFPARPGACGDGGNIVGFSRALYIHPNVETHGSWSAVNCVPGPAAVRLTIAGGTVTSVRTYVGTPKRALLGGTDLGDVRPQDAADYLLSLAAGAEGRVGKDAIRGAAIAADAVVGPKLLRLARDADRPRQTRTEAILWIGELGEEGALPALEQMAGDGASDMAIREAALMGLASLPAAAGVRALTRIALDDRDPQLAKKGIFWLAQTDDAGARRTLREMAASSDAPETMRGEAIFALGHLNGTVEDGRFLRGLYGRLTSAKLKDKLLQSVAQIDDDPEGERWLLGVVKDAGESLAMRKQALFWAGQRDGGDARALVALYPEIEGRELREHYTFVLSQSGEREATDRLMDIARSDPDREVRKKALFWLAQDKDPRVAQFLQKVIVQP